MIIYGWILIDLVAAYMVIEWLKSKWSFVGIFMAELC